MLPNGMVCVIYFSYLRVISKKCVETCDECVEETKRYYHRIRIRIRLEQQKELSPNLNK